MQHILVFILVNFALGSFSLNTNTYISAVCNMSFCVVRSNLAAMFPFVRHIRCVTDFFFVILLNRGDPDIALFSTTPFCFLLLSFVSLCISMAKLIRLYAQLRIRKHIYLHGSGIYALFCSSKSKQLLKTFRLFSLGENTTL